MQKPKITIINYQLVKLCDNSNKVWYFHYKFLQSETTQSCHKKCECWLGPTDASDLNNNCCSTNCVQWCIMLEHMNQNHEKKKNF